MRYLGIDYGEKRIGIALSDPDGKIAFPKGIILNKGIINTIRQLKTLIRKEGISKVVIGLPLGLSGQETDQTKKVRKFAEKLKKVIVIPIEFGNEMLTTRMARHAGISQKYVDDSSAALILQSYLDKRLAASR